MGQGILSITWANRWRSLSMANASAVAIERMTMACFRSASAMGLLPRGNGLDMPHGGGIPTRLGIGAIFLLPTTDDGNRTPKQTSTCKFLKLPCTKFPSTPRKVLFLKSATRNHKHAYAINSRENVPHRREDIYTPHGTTENQQNTATERPTHQAASTSIQHVRAPD